MGWDELVLEAFEIEVTHRLKMRNEHAPENFGGPAHPT